jgi:hypothetical protein
MSARPTEELIGYLRKMHSLWSWPQLGVTADRLAELQAENERLRAPSWDELLGYFDLIYPADVFTGVSGDPGPRMIVAIRELAAERALANELAEVLRQVQCDRPTVHSDAVWVSLVHALAHHAEARK